MHYEGAPLFRKSKLDVASPPLRCAGLRSAAAGGNCGGMSGAKEQQESIGKSAGEWHFTFAGKD